MATGENESAEDDRQSLSDEKSTDMNEDGKGATFFHNGEPSGAPRTGEPRSYRDGDPSPDSHSWARSYRQWSVKLPNKWKPVQGLGEGGHGVIGHWKYAGTDEECGPHDSGIKDVVIKQHVPVPTYLDPEDHPDQEEQKVSTALRMEEGLMLHLTHTGSRHFPQLYDTLHRDVGTGSHSQDMKNEEVQRLIMEYFGGGDLSKWIDPRSAIDEGRIRSIFVCLAKAVAVLDCGKENGDRDLSSEHTIRQWKENVVVHGDIRLPNIFVDDHNSADPEHARYPRVVLGDLGIAQWVPRNWDKLSPDEKDDLITNLRHDMDENHQPPEIKEKCELPSDEEVEKKDSNPTHIFRSERKLPARSRKLGSSVNVWQLGELMWLILTKEKPRDFKGDYYDTVEQEFERKFRGKVKCSEKLRNLVMRCLEPNPDDRPSPQILVQEAIEGLRGWDPTGAEVARRARLQPRSDRLLRKAQTQTQNWNEVLPTLRDIYLEEQVPGFEKWYVDKYGPVADQRLKDHTFVVEIDNGKPDPVVEEAPGSAPKSTENDAPRSTESDRNEGSKNGAPEPASNNQISMFRSVPSMASNCNAPHLPVDDVLGPAAPRDIPRPRAPLPRDIPEDDKTESSRPPLEEVQDHLSSATPSPTIQVIVNARPWCAGAGVRGIEAPHLIFPMSVDNVRRCTVKNLHALVVVQPGRLGLQVIALDLEKYRYTVAGNDRERLDPQAVLADLLDSDADKLFLNLNLKYSLLLTASVMRLRYDTIELACRILRNGQANIPMGVRIQRPFIGEITIKEIVDHLLQKGALLPELPRLTSSDVRVKLQDESDSYIYDGRANRPSYDNQLVAPYCIIGEVASGDNNKVAVLRLDVELQSATNTEGQIVHPSRLVPENFLFLVHVDVTIRYERPYKYKFACRTRARLEQVRRGVVKRIRRDRGSSEGQLYFQHNSQDLGDDERLVDLLESNSPACISIVAHLVPPITLLFWPQDNPSPARNEDEIAFVPVPISRDTTVRDLKMEIRRKRTQHIKERHPGNDIASALKNLVEQWAAEDQYRELDIRISGPIDGGQWDGVVPVLGDDVLVAEIDYRQCDPREAYVGGKVQRNLDALFKRWEEDDGLPPLRRAPPRPTPVLSTNNPSSCKPFGNFEGVEAATLTVDGLPGANPAPGGEPISVHHKPASSGAPSSSPSSSPVPSLPPQKPPTSLPTSPLLERRPGEVSDPGGDETGWYSDSSRNGESQLEVKVRCFCKGQRPKTYRCQKTDANGNDNTTNTLRDEIIAAAFYKPNVKAPMLRIRRPDRDQDLADNEPLSKSLPGAMRQLLCIAGDWEEGFSPVPPGLEEPVEGPREIPVPKPVIEQQPHNPHEGTPVTMIPIPQESGDPGADSDFSNMSDRPEGPPKQEIKVRCYRKSYRPLTFRTNLTNQDTGKSKTAHDISTEIIKSGIYKPLERTAPLHIRCTAEKPDAAHLQKNRVGAATYVTTAISTCGPPNQDQNGPIKLYCRYPAEENGSVQYTPATHSTATGGQTNNHPRKIVKPRKPGDETAWSSGEDLDDDRDEDEIEIRCFCKDKPARSVHTNIGEKTVTKLKDEILKDDKDFYPLGTKTADINLFNVGPPEAVISYRMKVKNGVTPGAKVIMCKLRNSDMKVDPFKPRPQSGAPKGNGGSSATGSNSSNKRKSPKRDANDSDKDAEAGAPVPKKSKTGNRGNKSTGHRKRKPKENTTSNHTEKSTDADDEDEDEDEEDKRKRSPAPRLEDAAAKTGESRLQTLPADVLRNIIHQVHHDEVRNLRLVSKYLKEKVVDPAIARTWCPRCQRDKAEEDFAQFDFLEGIIGHNHTNPPWTQPNCCLDCRRKPLGSLRPSDRFKIGQSFQDYEGEIFVRCEKCKKVGHQYNRGRYAQLNGHPRMCRLCWTSEGLHSAMKPFTRKPKTPKNPPPPPQKPGSAGKRPRDGEGGGGPNDGWQPPSKKQKQKGDKDGGEDNSGGKDDDKGDQSSEPVPSSQSAPVRAPATLHSLPAELIWRIALHLPTTRDDSNLKAACQYTRTSIDTYRYRTSCPVCNKTKPRNAFSCFDMRWGIELDDEGEHKCRDRPQFCLECGTRELALGGNVIWDRYGVEQGFQNFKGSVHIRCKKCMEVKCIHEDGMKPKNDEFRKQRRIKLCRECWAEGGDDESDCVHSSDLERAGIY